MREYAQQHLKADYIATGHYARLWHRTQIQNDIQTSPLSCIHEMLADTPEEEWIPTWGSSNSTTSSPLLLAGADERKDQSYFLCGVHGMAFSNVIFPLGDLIKDKNQKDMNPPTRETEQELNRNMSVREIASRSGLPTASKKDSMGICFIGKRKFPAFISEYLPPNESSSRQFIDIDTGEVSLYFFGMILLEHNAITLMILLSIRLLERTMTHLTLQ